jgi:aminoglycoside phosphotransferase (APT) family kinase protein
VLASSRRDEGAVRERLSHWFADHLGVAEVHLSALSGPAFSGFSNETLMFDVDWERDGAEHHDAVVLRVEPLGHQVFPDTAFRTQHDVLVALGAHTHIPVPPVTAFEEDPSVLGAPFLVMGKVEGRVPTDNPPYHMGGWMLEATPEDRERLWCSGIDVLADIAQVDRDACGLGNIEAIDVGGRLGEQRRYHDWAAKGRAHPVAERGMVWLADNLPASEGADALCWGDARIGNMIFGADGTCRAVLDWEMVTAGDPVQDLAWFLFLDRHHSEGLGVPRLDGFPDLDATIARWEDRTGRRAENLEWFEMLAATRFTSIMLRVIDLAIEAGAMAPEERMGFDNPCSALLAKLLDERGG